MKKKLLLLTTLLFTAISGAWAANNLYGVLDGTNILTLYYGDDSAVNGAVRYTYTDYNGTGSWYSDVRSATSVVTDESCRNFSGIGLARLFWGFTLATSIDLSNLNTSNVTNMWQMFYNCEKLTSVTFGTYFNTSNVTNMKEMFEGCDILENLDLSSFNTANVTNMSGMFYFCKKLTTLNVSSFNTSNVTNMSNMFRECNSLTSLDLSSFNTNKVEDMSYMFCLDNNGNGKLATIYVGGGWSITSVTSSTALFHRCDLLRGGAGTTFIDETITYARIDEGTSNPGYFTLSPNSVMLAAHSDEKATPSYWTTYYNASQSMVVPNATVYTAKVGAGNTSVTLTEVEDKVIPAGNAVILKGLNASVVMDKTTATGTLANNELKGGSTVTSGTPYTLAKPSGMELGFYKFTGTLDANKAHLEVASSGSGARQFIGIGGNGETTGIGDAPRLN
ncbi:MAG: BspA family leucine-rich repeat surface protein, partial [Prevotella sp.]|nr:BspA family leucine-rich repeat surface protein [Prevotella sp.]